ncbi:MAG: 1-phosphofructokinase [Lachnospiraceae bacterium]|nr:1-phosphofructokinase [Lachnospiraceae bacterium]
MIYTVTFNPALDYVVRVQDFTPGAVNRTCSEHIFYGGKGINVSAVLATLGFESTALGFIAGFTGDEIERGVKTLGFQSDFIRVKEGMSRINVKLKSNEESEINGMGPRITAEDVNGLFDKLEQLKEGDVLVLSGSIPASMDDRIYETIMAKLSGRGLRVVVDAEKGLLLNVLKYHPFLIKPNNHELGQMFGRVLKTEEEIAEHARRLQDMGAGNVLISMAGDGALLVTETGELYRLGVARGTVKNSVGAGDSMVAGFLAGFLQNGDYEHALKLGTAAGGATAFSDGLGVKSEIMKLYETL